MGPGCVESSSTCNGKQAKGGGGTREVVVCSQSEGSSRRVHLTCARGKSSLEEERGRTAPQAHPAPHGMTRRRKSPPARWRGVEVGNIGNRGVEVGNIGSVEWRRRGRGGVKIGHRGDGTGNWVRGGEEGGTGICNKDGTGAEFMCVCGGGWHTSGDASPEESPLLCGYCEGESPLPRWGEERNAFGSMRTSGELENS